MSLYHLVALSSRKAAKEVVVLAFAFAFAPSNPPKSH